MRIRGNYLNTQTKVCDGNFKNLGDSHKNDWKRWIKRKGEGMLKLGRCHSLNERPLPVSSVCFVPKTEGAELIQMLQGTEDELQNQTGWKVKLVK